MTFSRPKPNTGKRCANTAFTLIEMLVVVALMLIFLSLAVPAVSSVLAGVNLGRGGQQIADQIMLGRQNALTRNCSVEVRFIRPRRTANHRAIVLCKSGWWMRRGSIARQSVESLNCPTGS